MQTLYTTAQKFGVGKFFFVFFYVLKEVFYAHQGCIYFIKKYSKKQKFCEIYFCEYYFHEI